MEVGGRDGEAAFEAATRLPGERAAAQRYGLNPPALGGFGGGGGATLGVAGINAPAGPGATMPPQAKAPRTQGIRPIHIEVPRTGQRFVFTKVLNVGDETLRLGAWAMTGKVLNVFRSSLQAAAFLAGLLLLWRQ